MTTRVRRWIRRVFGPPAPPITVTVHVHGSVIASGSVPEELAASIARGLERGSKGSKLPAPPEIQSSVTI